LNDLNRSTAMQLLGSWTDSKHRQWELRTYLSVLLFREVMDNVSPPWRLTGRIARGHRETIDFEKNGAAHAPIWRAYGSVKLVGGRHRGVQVVQLDFVVWVFLVRSCSNTSADHSQSRSHVVHHA
jgi:hypothetical protein